MNRLLIVTPAVLTVVLAGLANSEPGAAQQPAAPRGQPAGGGNAAEVYRKAFAFMEGRRPIGLTDEECTELYDKTITGRVQPNDVERVRELMARVAPLMSTIEPAGVLRRSDFELDHTKGSELLLPHLSQMRSASRLLQAEAALAINDADWEATLGSVQSLAAIGSHAGQDRVLISSLVGTAVARTSLGPIDGILDEGTLTQDRAEALAEGLRGYRGVDPFNYGDSLRGEYVLLASTVNGKNGDEVAAQLEIPDAGPLRGMSDRELARGVARSQSLFESAARAFENPDPAAARQMIAELEREVEKNPVLVAMMPALGRALETKLLIDEEIAERLARIDAIAEGKKSALESANASTWFRRAAAVADGISEEGQEAIELILFSGDQVEEPFRDRAVRLQLGAGRTILECVERGLACGALDFDSPNDGDYGLSAQWLPGLRAACRVLLARARVAEDAEAAVLANMVLRVSLLLTRDPSVTRSLVARTIANETIPLLTRVAASEATSQKQREDLLKSVRDLSASSAFGIGRGLDADRDRLAALSALSRTIDPSRRKHLSRRSAEFSLFLQVAMAPELARSGSVAGPLSRFDDILPPKPTAEARDCSGAVRSSRFFQFTWSTGAKGEPEKDPLRSVRAVEIRSHGKDLADCATSSTKLSEAANLLERPPAR